MKALNRSYGVALVLIGLVCSSASCKLPGGPFVTLTIVGIPKETTKLVMTAVLADQTRMVENTPTVTQLQMTLNMPPEARGSLVVTAQATVDGTPCKLANGTVTVELLDDIAYEAILLMVDAPLDGCQNIPTLKTVDLTVYKMLMGGSGSIVSVPAGINCDSNCTEQTSPFRINNPVTLIARLAAGSQVSWSEPSCDNSRVCTVPMTAATTVTAKFTACAHPSWCDEGAPDVTSNLNGVWGNSTSNVFAVGDNGTILRRVNNQWSLQTSGVMPDKEGKVPSLRAIGAEKNSAAPYVGGDSGTLLRLNNKTTWSSVTVDALKGKQITGITGDANGFLGPSNAYFLSTIDGGFYYNGNDGAWALIASPDLSGKVLHGVGSTNASGFPFTGGREAMVVGDGGFALRRTADISGAKIFNISPSTTPTPITTDNLRGVWSGGGLTVAVGDNGTIIKRGTQDYGSGTPGWTKVSSPVTTRLTAVWGGDDNNIWIVGDKGSGATDGGVILKYDGTTVTPQMNVPKVDLVGVWAADKNQSNVYAVGRNGTILHYIP